MKGLEVGDTLEVQTRQKETKPLDPGQFWATYQFFRAGISLDEQLEIRVPKARTVQVKSPAVQPTITQEGGYKVYRWKTSNLKEPSKDAAGADETPESVELTSFQNWDEFGQWERSLFAPRVAPTPEIQAKAAELTKGAKTETEKIQDLYTFVSTKYRYIGIALGIGRLQPHAASDVLSNDYGDCKDKHTLFAALLAAVGVKAFPALINSSAKVEADMPSPEQFDHVITAIPQSKGFLFLDTTPEVSPFGYLISPLRGKQALVIPDSGPAELVETPADPPFPSFFDFEADGTLDDAGTLESKMQMTMRGDAEVLYRIGFRAAGQSQWDTVMQSASQSMGFGGKVSDVTATSPETTDTPFHVAYNYHREKFSDWADKQITMALPGVDLPDVPDKTPAKAKPIDTGSPGQEKFEARIKLPPGFSTQTPAAVHLKEDFADYDADYSLVEGTLRVVRTLVTKEREIPPAQFEKLRQFEKAVTDDETTYIRLSSPVSAAAAQPQPASSNTEAQQFYEHGQEAWSAGDIEQARHDFQQAVEKDPQFAEAWIRLGSTYFATRNEEQAVAAMRKAIAINPKQEFAYGILSSIYMGERQPEDALAIWRELEKAAPDNPDAPKRVAALLKTMGRYSEALPELEAAVKQDPDSVPALLDLGLAYAEGGDKGKTVETLEKVQAKDSSANTLNSIAYSYAEANVRLDEALKLSQQAVNDAEEIASKAQLGDAMPPGGGDADTLTAYWDTLGWVHFRMGHYADAEKYLSAAWHLSEQSVNGDHLGQVYEKEGKKRLAIETYAEAVVTAQPADHARERLKVLRGREQTEMDRAGANATLQDRRQAKVEVANKPPDPVDARFTVLLTLGPGGAKITAEKFVSGSDKLRDRSKTLETATFDMPSPDNSAVRIVRTGDFNCDPYVHGCIFVLYPLGASVTVRTQIAPVR